MCGRFGQYNLSYELLRRVFRIDNEPDLTSTYNIAPSREALIVGENPQDDRRSAQYLRWGLIPSWVDDPKEFDLNLINARAETVHRKNSFRKPFHRQRCVVPARGFYEWKSTESGKQPYWIQPEGEDLFGFAGLWDVWIDEDEEESVRSFTILTREVNDELAELHDRMPVILNSDRYDDWLDPDRHKTGELQSMTKEGYEGSIDYYPVSPAVNNPEFDEPECVEPLGE